MTTRFGTNPEPAPLLKQAEKCRRLAQEIPDDRARCALHELAAEYEAQALEMRQSVA